MFFLFFFPRQGNGHYFPLKSLSESHNPLLANEEMWEESDDGSEEGSIGEHFGTLSSLESFPQPFSLVSLKCCDCGSTCGSLLPPGGRMQNST